MDRYRSQVAVLLVGLAGSLLTAPSPASGRTRRFAPRRPAPRAARQDRRLAAAKRVLADLSHPDPRRRARAAYAAGQARISGARKLLRRLLRDRDPEVRRAAATALGQVGRPEDAILLHDQLIREGRPGVLTALVEALGRLRYRPARKSILRALGRSSSALRAVAIVALGRLGDPDDLWFLERFLRSADPGMRRSAAIALTALGDRRAVAMLCRALEDPTPAVVAAAASGLAALGSSEQAPALARLLAHPSRAVRIAAARALQRLGTPQERAALSHLLEDPEPEVAAAAAVALARLGGQPPAGQLARLMRSRVSRARADALRAAGLAGLRALIPDILPHCWATHRPTRLAAIAALGQLAASQAIAQLVRALSETTDPTVRAALLRALGALRAQEATGAARALLADASPRVRAAAAYQLAQAARLDPRPLAGLAPALTPLLRPAQPRAVLCAAADAFSLLASRQDRRGFVYLQRLTFSPDPRVRACALRGLGRYGDHLARPAVLRLLRRDPSLDVRLEAWLAALRLGARLREAWWMRGLRACPLSGPLRRARCLAVRARERGRLSPRERRILAEALNGLPDTPARAALVPFLAEALGSHSLPLLRLALSARGYGVRAAARRALSIWPPPVAPHQSRTANTAPRRAVALPRRALRRRVTHLFEDPKTPTGSGCRAAGGPVPPLPGWFAWLVAAIALRRRLLRAMRLAPRA